MRRNSAGKIIFIAIIMALLIAGWLYFIKGYVGIRKRGAVPAGLISEAQVPGMKDIRLVADPMKAKNSSLHKLIEDSGLIKAEFKGDEINILAISGGGANGAYAAGVLCGWTEAGDRPDFDIVTGVSTGALIAPAAFLGPSYDGLIQDIYTNITNTDIARQNFVQFLFQGRPSLLDTQPLRGVLRRAVTMEVLNAVAREYVAGRRLYIATTNLDARRMVIWDMGAIASYRTPEALELFRNVMLASASIPVAFPPVMIEVEALGRIYDEMHADGSIATQLFGSMLITGYEEVKNKKTNVFAIRNGKFADVPQEVPYKVWDIAGAAFSTLMTWQSYGDIYRFYTLAKYEKINFYFSCIPYEFNETRHGEFDLSYMRKLFYRGYKMAVSGGHWIKPEAHGINNNAKAE
ncbi:MAG: patatin-like phospholipase family protein [Candidatus Omnitrophica bacterium]|nr:patatin-like phospholipase family protein [Candidatus Omnitrophota bacterium]